jgi:hypothetical protein
MSATTKYPTPKPHEQSQQSILDNQERERRMDECAVNYKDTLIKLRQIAKQLEVRPNRTSFLMIKDRVLGPDKKRFPKPDRLALRYPEALVCWFCQTPDWPDFVFDTANPVDLVVPVVPVVPVLPVVPVPVAAPIGDDFADLFRLTEPVTDFDDEFFCF